MYYPLGGIIVRWVFFVIVLLFLAGCKTPIAVDPKVEVDYFGVLDVSSEPPGATVWIDHNPWHGVTPTQIVGLPARQYELSLVREGFQDWSQQIVIEGNKTTVVKADLIPVSSTP